MAKRKIIIHRRRPAFMAVLVLVVVIGIVTLLRSLAATYWGAPSVTATAADNATYSVTIKWTASTVRGSTSQPTTWTIYFNYPNGNGGSWSGGNSSGGTTTIGGLTCSNSYTYSFEVVGFAGGQQASYANSASASVPCPTPTNLSISATSSNVFLNWSGPSFVTSYTVEYSEYGNGNYIAYNEGTGTSFSITGFCGTTPSAYVVGSANGESGTSTTVSATAPACSQPTPTPTPVPTPTPTPNPKAPSVTLSSLTADGTSSVTAKWTMSPNPVTSVQLYLKTNSGSFVGSTLSGSATTDTFGASCGNTYNVFITATNKNGTGTSTTKSVTTAACALAGGGSSGGSSGGGSSGASSGTPKSTTTTKTVSSAPAPVAATVPQAPAAPTNFTANVVASRIVELSWTPSVATSTIASYELDRSTDNVNWTNLANASGTSYEDDATNYDMIYYYRVRAVDSAGLTSDYATAQITTSSFKSTASTITSNDKVATAHFVSDTFNQAAQCSIIKPTSLISTSLANQAKLLVGPYEILCIGEDGSRLTDFDKPVNVSIQLGDQAKGHTNFTAERLAGSGLATVKDTYNAKTHIVSFQLSASQPFAIYAQRQHSLAGIIWGSILALLALGGLIVGFRFLQSRLLAAHDAAVVSGAPGQELLAQALNKPDCTHINQTHQVQPLSDGCQECLATGQQWRALRICLTCGHVGCSDDSPNQHAHQHFEQTGHPIIMAYNEPAAANIGWCYIDQTYV